MKFLFKKERKPGRCECLIDGAFLQKLLLAFLAVNYFWKKDRCFYGFLMF